jgi:cellulose synthase/poly-beta-1,6-N-acetylglucosamine synthase-like glycosyltransferase
MDTIRASCVIDYPKSKFRVLVADDGSDMALEAQVADLKKSAENLFYFARDKSGIGHHGFKAGNLNAAIKHYKSLPGNPAPWIAVLDADMIPEPEMLLSLAKHTNNDVKIGMVALPQHFYNIPVDDPLNQDTLPYFNDEETLRNQYGASLCPGTGFLIRESALAEVGGFPETSICEDLLLGWLLQGRGWHTVFVNEKLQWGLQPDCFSSHVKQRIRWVSDWTVFPKQDLFN